MAINEPQQELKEVALPLRGELPEETPGPEKRALDLALCFTEKLAHEIEECVRAQRPVHWTRAEILLAKIKHLELDQRLLTQMVKPARTM